MPVKALTLNANPNLVDEGAAVYRPVKALTVNANPNSSAFITCFIAL